MKDYELTKTQEIIFGGSIFIVGLFGFGFIGIVLHSITTKGF